MDHVEEIMESLDSQNNDQDGENNDDSQTPVVFQCVQCNTILGDSVEWDSGSSEMNTATLSGVTDKVVVTKSLITSTDGKDIGSTYSLLKCNSCYSEVGKVYKTTPKALDELRDLFTFDLRKVKSYALGSASQTAGNTDREDRLCIPGAKFLFVQIRKIQSLILTFNERLKAIERCMENDANSGLDGDISADDSQEPEPSEYGQYPVAQVKGQVVSTTEDKHPVNKSNPASPPRLYSRNYGADTYLNSGNSAKRKHLL